MNLRKLIVKSLYPMCSDEVQILLDQMQNSPDKFVEMFDTPPYRIENPWYRAMQSGNFELIDHVALRQQLKLLKVKYAKQLILEGLLEANELASNRDANLDMFDSLIQTATKGASSQPTKIHMNKAQYDIAKKLVDAEASKKTMKMQTKARYVKGTE